MRKAAPEVMKLRNQERSADRRPRASGPWRFARASVKITCPTCGYAVPSAERCAICRSPLVKTSRVAILVTTAALLAIAAAVLSFWYPS